MLTLLIRTASVDPHEVTIAAPLASPVAHVSIQTPDEDTVEWGMWRSIGTTIHKRDCVRPIESTVPTYAPLPAVPTTDMSRAQDILGARLELYQHVLTTDAYREDALVARNANATSEDALSYALMMWVVAMHERLNRGVSPEFEAVRGKVLRAERALARFRLLWGGVPQIGKAREDGRVGLPWEDHLVLFRQHALGVGEMDGGLLYLPPLHWLEQVVDAVALEDTIADLKARVVPTLLRPYLDEMYGLLRTWEVDAVVPPPAAPASTPSRPSVVVSPVQDIEDLRGIMPACMRELAAKAFHPRVPGHLGFEQRGIFYRFALASGVGADALEEALSAKFQGAFPEPNYRKTTINAEIRTNQKFLRRVADYSGDGCNKLQACGLCPFGAGANARVACHTNQNAMLKRLRDPNDKWVIGSPLAFAQQVKAAHTLSK